MKSIHSSLKIRFIYIILILTVIAAGILSRKTDVIPPIVGDMLYSIMMFLIIRFLLLNSSYRNVGIISLSICYCIELSQLYSAPWIDNFRNTTLGALILGHGFLWSDMAAYTAGTIICLLLFYTLKPFNSHDKVALTRKLNTP